MNKLLTLFLVLTVMSVKAQDSLNMTRLSVWTSPAAVEYNDCWGYTDPLGNEYVILGSNWGIHFINVTDPQNPIEVNSFEGNNNDVIWRDFKIFGTTAYGVADQYSFNNAALSIFDLSNLPTSVTMVKQQESYSHACHNIYIDGNLLYMCSNQDVNDTRWALEVFTLEVDPTDPLLVISMDDSYFGGGGSLVHDIYVRNDTAYLSAGYGGLYIYDFSDASNPQFINSITTYTSQGYNHSSWLHPDRHTLVVADEVPNSLPLKAFDVSNVLNISSAPPTFQSNVGARPHNPFFVYNDVVVSYYLDGLQIFDFTDPAAPVRTAFYDTYPDNDTLMDPYPDVFQGAWGTYPFFKSGNIAVADIDYGLNMVTKITDIYTNVNTLDMCDQPTALAPIAFTAKGNYNTGNVYYLEMADANGSFASPTVLDSIASGTAGTFTFNFDPSSQSGTTFRLRVSASNPQMAQSSWITVNYSQTPTMPTIVSNAGVLTASNTTASSYQWFVDGTAIAGATSSTYTPTTSGIYTVSASNGTCTSAISNQLDYTLSMNEGIASNMRINVFPNPSNGKVNFYNPTLDKLVLEMYNATGEQVKTLTTSAKMTEMEMERGVYFVNVSGQQTSAYLKLVVY